MGLINLVIVVNYECDDIYYEKLLYILNIKIYVGKWYCRGDNNI